LLTLLTVFLVNVIFLAQLGLCPVLYQEIFKVFL